MKKSTGVPLTLMASVAAIAASACNGSDRSASRCVDQNNVVVADSLCGPEKERAAGGFYPYHPYYGGYGGFVIGSMARGGSFSPSARSSSSEGVSRGGFGATGRGVSGGGS